MTKYVGNFFVHARNLNGEDVMYKYSGALPKLAYARALYIWSLDHGCVLRFDTAYGTDRYDCLKDTAPVVDNDWLRMNDFLPRVLTRAEVQQRLDVGLRITIISSSRYRAFFYSTNNCLSVWCAPVLDSSWVQHTTKFPLVTGMRPHLPEGTVQRIEDYETLFHNKKMAYLSSDSILQELLNQKQAEENDHWHDRRTNQLTNNLHIPQY